MKSVTATLTAKIFSAYCKLKGIAASASLKALWPPQVSRHCGLRKFKGVVAYFCKNIPVHSLRSFNIST
jgi:hypothetical protein